MSARSESRLRTFSHQRHSNNDDDDDMPPGGIGNGFGSFHNGPRVIFWLIFWCLTLQSYSLVCTDKENSATAGMDAYALREPKIFSVQHLFLRQVSLSVGRSIPLAVLCTVVTSHQNVTQYISAFSHNALKLHTGKYTQTHTTCYFNWIVTIVG